MAEAAAPTGLARRPGRPGRPGSPGARGRRARALTVASAAIFALTAGLAQGAARAGGAGSGLQRLPAVPVGRAVSLRVVTGGTVAIDVTAVVASATPLGPAPPGRRTVAVYLGLLTTAGPHNKPSARSVLRAVEAHGVLAVSGSNAQAYQPGNTAVAGCRRLGRGTKLGRQWTASGCYTFELPSGVSPRQVLFTPLRTAGSRVARWNAS